MPDASPLKTIAILYPGEMGAGLGKLLAEGGLRVITTAAGRSARTQQLAREAGLEQLDSLDALLAEADVVLSLVSPAAALQVAEEVAQRLQNIARKPLFVDLNSISPYTAQEIAATMLRAPVPFVDGTIFGLASMLRERGSLYLSGEQAQQFADVVSPRMRVKVVGDKPGQASAFKMTISAIPKGLSALFAEIMLFASEMQLLPEALAACEEIYPAVLEIMRRMLPTYPQHAGRRCQEIQEVEKTMRRSGVEPRIMHAVEQVTAEVAKVDWEEIPHTGAWSMEEVLLALHAQQAKSRD